MASEDLAGKAPGEITGDAVGLKPMSFFALSVTEVKAPRTAPECIWMISSIDKGDGLVEVKLVGGGVGGVGFWATG